MLAGCSGGLARITSVFLGFVGLRAYPAAWLSLAVISYMAKTLAVGALGRWGGSP